MRADPRLFIVSASKHWGDDDGEWALARLAGLYDIYTHAPLGLLPLLRASPYPLLPLSSLLLFPSISSPLPYLLISAHWRAVFSLFVSNNKFFEVQTIIDGFSVSDRILMG